MTASARYCVHLTGLHRPHARMLDAPSEEAAALAWLEDNAAWLGHDEPDLTLIVRDLETGRERCLRVGLHGGPPRPCD